MASPPPAALDLDITLISAKHLKNVNWRSGPLKPYAAASLDPDRRLSTRPDEHGSTSPVWNERFTLPLPSSLADALLTIEIFHSRPSETPKPLVGSLRIPLGSLVDPAESSPDRDHKLELLRPSGRPQGKVRVRLALRGRRSHSSAPESSYYSAAAAVAPLPPPAYPYPYPYPRDYRDALPSPRYGYSDQLPGYYYSQYSAPPAWPPQFSRPPSHGTQGGPSAPPSAPVDFSYPTAEPKPMPMHPPNRWIPDHGPPSSVNLTRSDSYGALPSGPTAPEDQRPPRGPEAVAPVADAFGGMSLGEGSRHGADYAWRENHGHGPSSGDYRRTY